MRYDNVSICIPAFNEEAAVEDALRALKDRFPEAEIIVVDDGSRDGTADAARRVAGVRVLSHGRNIGYGAALKTAMRRAQGEVVVWCDSDGQHRPEDVAKVLAPVLADEADAVIGVRGRGSDVTLNRLPGKFALKIIAEWVVRQKIPDLNSGLRAFRRAVIMRYIHLLPDGFSASTTSTLLMIKRGYRLAHVDILTKKRIGISSVKMLRDGWNAIQLILRVLILFEAFNFFTVVSALQVIPAVVYGVSVAMANRLGFPNLASMVVISGVLTFFMGLVCDQIVAMRKEKFERD